MQKRLAGMLAAIDYTDMGAAIPAVKAAMEACCLGGNRAASVLAADFYDAVRYHEVGTALGASADGGFDAAATDGAVSAIVQKGVDGNTGAMETLLAQRIDYEVKRASAVSVMRASRRDRSHPRYARVPSGGETCRFCMMLASRGAAYTSRESAGENGHYHANCDCRIVPSWSGGIEGYDPDALYDRWRGMVRDDARAAAERNGTTEAEEQAAIIARLEEAAKASKNRSRR